LPGWQAEKIALFKSPLSLCAVGRIFDPTEDKKISRSREAYFLSLDYVSFKKEAL
jgi:hypothetical protein